MTSNLIIPPISKENSVTEVTGFKALVGKRMQKKVKFLDVDVTIYKLNVQQVMEIQELVKAVNEEDDDANFNVLQYIITKSVDGAEDLTEEDFKTFPMDELSKLSNEIMKFSGMGAQEKGK
jgi:hypothetical protein